MPSVMMNSVQRLEKQMGRAGIGSFIVINKRGRMVDSFGKNELNISKEKRDVLFMQLALQFSMQDDQNEDFGKVQFCIIKREKSKFFCQRLDEDKIAVIVASNKADDKEIINNAGQLSKIYLSSAIPQKMEMLQI
jgi:hypothetical protein